MPITRTNMVDDDGSGNSGTIINAAWKTELYNQIDALTNPAFGSWTDVPFSAANFTAGGSMTWTVTAGQVQHNRYLVMGKTVLWSAYVSGSTLAGTASAQVRIAFPVTPVRTPGFLGPTAYLVDNAPAAGYVIVTASGYAAVNKTTNGNYVLNAGTTAVAFILIYDLA